MICILFDFSPVVKVTLIQMQPTFSLNLFNNLSFSSKKGGNDLSYFLLIFFPQAIPAMQYKAIASNYNLWR